MTGVGQAIKAFAAKIFPTFTGWFTKTVAMNSSEAAMTFTSTGALIYTPAREMMAEVSAKTTQTAVETTAPGFLSKATSWMWKKTTGAAKAVAGNSAVQTATVLGVGYGGLRTYEHLNPPPTWEEWLKKEGSSLIGPGTAIMAAGLGAAGLVFMKDPLIGAGLAVVGGLVGQPLLNAVMGPKKDAPVVPEKPAGAPAPAKAVETTPAVTMEVAPPAPTPTIANINAQQQASARQV